MTPLRRQYLQIKRRYPDTIVFFRLGDFYETFDDDAKITSAELEIVLTSREMGKGQRVPMAGIPHHAVDSYLAKLINRGHKVAIVEQTSDPETSRGLVDREVVRVVTPGTVVEPTMLDSKANNYLAAALVEGKQIGLAYVDITTGEFATTQISGDLAALQHELARLCPAECLVPKLDSRAAGRLLDIAALVQSLSHASLYEAWHFDLETAREVLLRHLEVTTLSGFGCENLPLAVRAAGAILQYLEDTQKVSLSQLTTLRTYSTSGFMVLDAATRRNLELTQSTRQGSLKGSLLWVLDRTSTPMGGRLLRRWLSEPLLDIDRLRARQEAIEELVGNTIVRAKLAKLLGRCADLERLINRVGQRLVTPRELISLRATLETAAAIGELMNEPSTAVLDQDHPPTDASMAANQAPISILASRLGPLPDCGDIVHLIAQAIVAEPPATLYDGGVIAPGFSDELDSIRSSSRDARQWIAGLERSERERTAIKSLKVGYNKVFGYYLEVTNPNLEAPLNEQMRGLVQREVDNNPALASRPMPTTIREYLEVFCGYSRKQTLVNAERYVTTELKEYESQVLNAQERIVDLETRIYRQVCDQISAASERVQRTARILAHLDVFTALAEVAVRNNYRRPTLTDEDEIRIIGGRHPVVELSLDEPFVPNDVHLSNREAQLIILTGPNMAGKSTYLRQVALIVLMAQIGSFVPAESARIGLVDRIFTRVGAQDDIATGQSTFMVEMTETANLLTQSTPRSLLVLDEVGRGTSTYDGLAIARAVVEYIHNHPSCCAKTLFATHYHELTELEKYLPRVRNYNMAVLEEGDKVVFLRKVVPGGADRSYGIYVAKLAGLPKAVTRRAEEILKELEASHRVGGGQRNTSRSARSACDQPPPAQGLQLPLFGAGDGLVEEIARLDVMSMTPIEALAKLYELSQRAREGS